MGRVRETLENLLGYAEQYNCYMTLQFKVYSVMRADMFDAEASQLRHQTQFPIDEQNYYEMGKKLVSKAREMTRKDYW
ncbi:MAG: hypothetical protein K2J70_07420 [Muribaculaceae bacterium]|nr:hypothetical protein [Muribaculaceae bacterium]